MGNGGAADGAADTLRGGGQAHRLHMPQVWIHFCTGHHALSWAAGLGCQASAIHELQEVVLHRALSESCCLSGHRAAGVAVEAV